MEEEIEGVTIISEDEHQRQLELYRLPSRILQFLYIGDRFQGRNEKLITDSKITHILNVDTSARFPSSDAPYTFLHVPISDFGDEDLLKPKKLPRCFKYIEDAKAKNGLVLVHCSKGINRSPTVVMAYLIAIEKWTLEKAYKHVVECRSMASPHEKYFEQLQTLEKQIHNKITLTRKDIGPSIQQQIRELRKELQNSSLDSDSSSSSSSPSSSGSSSSSTLSLSSSLSTSSMISSFSSSSSSLS